MKKLLCICALTSAGLPGGSLIVGINEGFGNLFPFGGPRGGAGTRYQQAYDKSLFSSTLSITGIDFFSVGLGSLYAGTYQLRLSTITAGVNTLSNTNFGSNIGPDNTVFTTVTLAGSAPSKLTFIGGPFSYNPANGNLLLDIQITNTSAGSPDAAFQGALGSGPATIARYQDFGTGTTGFGLVTQFDFAVPEPGTFVLFGCGLTLLVALARDSNRSVVESLKERGTGREALPE